MRIVFLGLPLAACLLAVDGHDVVLAGLRKGLGNGARRLATRIGRASIVWDPQGDWGTFRSRAQGLGADLLVSWFFTRRIPMSVVGTCRLGGIGVHPSLLPRHRGPDPFFATLDAGDEVTGVTVHRLAAEYDAGEVLSRTTLRIEPEWNAWDLARRLDRPSLAALRETVKRAAAGDALVGEPQDERLATPAPQPGDDERELRWAWSAERIVRRVRALAPEPAAVTWVGDSCLAVVSARCTDDLPRALEPGEAAVLRDRVVVRAADRGVELVEVECDGALLRGDALASFVLRATGK